MNAVGLHHVARRTADLDRLAEFYRTLLGAAVAYDATEDGHRDVVLDLGAGGLLHLFAMTSPQMTDRQTLEPVEHFGIELATREAFLEARDRLVRLGRSDGRVRDLGRVWSVYFTDPDSTRGEIVWTARPGGRLVRGRTLTELEVARTCAR